MSDSPATLAFEPLTDRAGMAVIDRIEHQRFECHTADPVSPLPVPAESFHYPVERAAEFTTRELSLPTVALVYVRNADGVQLAEVGQGDVLPLPEGEFILELSAQIKTYVEVEAAVEISVDAAATTITFDAPATVRLGVRSRHERPAATVTTTADPMDVMRAVETFGSALKVTNPERAFPTLRGHPPAVELGEKLDVPSTVEPPSTGVRLELPLQYDALFVAAPLAYYLGASLEPGPSPRLVTDAGFEHSFSSPAGYETEMVRTLKQVFFLDCITRTEGLYEIPLHEREVIEPVVDLGFAHLYGQSLECQVAAYLDVPYEVIEDHLPEWRLTTHVEPVADTVEQLPFVLDDLAIVRTSAAGSTGIGTSGGVASTGPSGGGLTRSAGKGAEGEPVTYVQPADDHALEQAWIGDDVPVGASKLTTAAFHNRLDRSPTEGDISIAIVVNDGRMDDEGDVVDDVYGDHDELPFDVEVHRATTVGELREVLSTQTGFLHYVGHIEPEGLECADGKLDARELDATGVEAFCLNACKSYEQGLGLIEAGAIGGIVTLQDIVNDGAVRMGETLARLLDAGFPLRAALTIAREEHVQGGQYIVVGDGGMTVAQCESRTPLFLEITTTDGALKVDITGYPTDDAGLGTFYVPHLGENETCFLNSGTAGPFFPSPEEFEEFLGLQNAPVRIDGDLYWSKTLDIAEYL